MSIIKTVEVTLPDDKIYTYTVGNQGNNYVVKIDYLGNLHVDSLSQSGESTGSAVYKEWNWKFVRTHAGPGPGGWKKPDEGLG